MTDAITVEQVVEAARGLDKEEFTRAEVASALNVERPEIREAFKAARKEGRLRKVSEDGKGKPHFQVTK
jgi:DNA-binding transcriptional regulator LsrR (DeoR family)